MNIAGGTGDPVTLKGGAQPMTTEEDSGEDAFQPLRTQTGYIRIVDDGKDANGNAWDWKDLIPATDTSRPMSLSNGQGTTLWQGFLQAQNFGSILYGNPQEREFPIQDCIEALNSIRVSTNPTQLHSFAWLLYDCFVTRLPYHQFATFVIQGGSDARQWLLQRFDWQNFLRENDDGELEAAYTLKEALEEMCKYWGWCLRTKGNTVYMTCMDDSDEQTLLTLTTAELQSLAGGTSAGTVTQGITTIAYSGDMFASIENDDYLDRGPNKVEVTANCNEHEIVMQALPKIIENQLRQQTWQWVSPQHEDMVGYFETPQIGSFDTSLLHGDTRSTFGAFSCRQIYTSAEADEAAETDMILVNHVYDGLPIVSLQTKKPMSFAKGSLEINGTIYFDDQVCDLDGSTQLIMRLGIGMSRATARWWFMNNTVDGSTAVVYGWTQQGTPAEFCAGVMGGAIKSTGLRILTIMGWGYTSYRYIPTIIGASDANMYGYMFVDILGLKYNYSDYVQTFQIADFKVSFSRDVIELPTDTQIPRSRVKRPNRDHTHKYTANNPSSCQQEYSIDTIFASDNLMLWGYGLVLDPSQARPVGKEPYRANAITQYPEQHMANRVASYWTSSKRRLKVELRSDTLTGQKPEPTPVEKVTMDGTIMQAIAINHEWRDDVTTMYLLQM